MASPEYKTDSDSDEYDRPINRRNEGQSSDQQKSSDLQKFDRAKSLDVHILEIRKRYNDVFDHPVGKSTKQQQIAVILYLLDLTGYRPGLQRDNLKEGGRGVSNLAGCHIVLLGHNRAHFVFKGKHDILYDKIHEVKRGAYHLLEKFLSGAETVLPHVTNPEQLEMVNAKRLVFNEIKYSDLDLKEFGIQLKDFRTYNASTTFERVLNDLTDEWKEANSNADENEKLLKLKQFHTEAREVVRVELNHKSVDARDSYIDPRIVVAWCKRNEISPSELNGFKPGDKTREQKEWAIKRENENFVFSQRSQRSEDD